MADLNDARGNRDLVATPQEIGLTPGDAGRAARDTAWIAPVLRSFGLTDHGVKHADGLLIGPFQQEPPFDLLIVNTDTTLAERSGNGLTIFARALRDRGVVEAGAGFELRVHHGGQGAPTPLSIMARLGPRETVWLDMGRPAIGPDAVGTAYDVDEVEALRQLDPQWRRSIFVRLGNPHCVTLLSDPRHLPTMARLHALQAPLTRIAFAPPLGAGVPCPGGVNLQWAAVAGPNLLAARIFERGEGPTRSSGTSACAVATAAHHLGLVDGPMVRIRMPGGVAQVSLEVEAGQIARVHYRGVARRIKRQLDARRPV